MGRPSEALGHQAADTGKITLSAPDEATCDNPGELTGDAPCCRASVEAPATSTNNGIALFNVARTFIDQVIMHVTVYEPFSLLYTVMSHENQCIHPNHVPHDDQT